MLDDDQVPFDDAEQPPEPDDGLHDDPAAIDAWENETRAEYAAWNADPARDEERAADEARELERLGVDLPDAPTRAEQLRIATGQARATRMAERGWPDIDGMLNEPEPEYRWLIPGLLERGDRVILTGPEGKGKSTFLRQLGMQAASGIHPFTLEPVTPVRVLYIDLENSRRQTRRQMRPLRLSAGDRYVHGFMITINWPAGVDLRTRDGVAELEDLVGLAGVDLLITGPIYKLAHGDPNTEEQAKPIAEVFDALRTIHDFALFLEAHTPHAQGQSTKRPERPYGASLWMRWPEFGLHLADGGALTHWRGDRDDDRAWPEALKRGGNWPWTAITDRRSVTWARIIDVTRDAGRQLSNRDLAHAIGGDQSTIGRAIKANQAAYDTLIAEVEGADPDAA